MSEFQNIRQKFEGKEAKRDHVVINLKADYPNAGESRRISLTTLEWLSGKVDSLRRKFSATNIEKIDKEVLKKRTMKKIDNNGTRRVSESDGDLVEICKKYQICSANRYTWISEPFETIVLEYGDLVQTSQIEIHRETLEGENEPPKGLLLLPMSRATGQALLDFTEMGGYSLGRGSRVAKMATRALSRTHCMIYLENNCVYIKDCDSKTGTFVNGKLLGSSSPTPLKNFDIIQMGYGTNFEDYIQSMVVFLDNWNSKAFASIIQHLNANAPTMYSRTFSNSVSDLKTVEIESEQQKKTVTSPLVSSPKLTEITGQAANFKRTLIKSSPVIEADSETDNEAKETIVFEKPEPIMKPTSPRVIEMPHYERVEVPPLPVERSPQIQKPQVEEIVPIKVHYHRKGEDHLVHVNSSPRNVDGLIASPRKVVEYFEVPSPSKATEARQAEVSSPYQSPQQSARRAASSPEPEEITFALSPRPPKPKPRRVQKGLSKSADLLVEVELEEIVEEVEQRKKQEPKRTITKMPIETALAARRTSVTQQPVMNVAIPEFLKSENLKIPASSPAQDLIFLAKMMKSSNNPRKLNLPVGKKRKDRIDQFIREAQFTTIVQGAETKRFENFVDFGSVTSDISDGLAESHLNKKESIKIAFNNFKMTWTMESLNVVSGNKLIIQSSNAVKNNYFLAVEGKSDGSSMRIGEIEMNFKTKNYMKISFKINESIYKEVTGTEIDEKYCLPLRALEQLTYFYPHLEAPSLVIQGPIDSSTEKATITLVTSQKIQPIGRLVFEGQKVSWSKRQMVYALDLDTMKVEIDSLLCDTIQSAALLYCLRYHID
jgi:hypothetical protein